MCCRAGALRRYRGAAQVPRRGADHQALLAEATGDQFRVVLEVTDAYRQVDALVDHVGFALAKGKGQVQLGIAPGQCDQPWGDMPAAKRSGKINAQAPLGLGNPTEKTAFDPAQFLHHPQATGQVHLAFVGEAQLARAAVQQLDAQALLQARYALAHRRIGHAQLQSRRRKAAQLRRQDKFGDTVELKGLHHAPQPQGAWILALKDQLSIFLGA